MKNTNTRKLVESALMVAVATVLSLFKLAELPYGGSITLASMLPVIIIAYRNGLGWGLGTGVVYAALQQVLGLKTLSYVTTPGSVIAVIMLDYIVAFTVCGLGGVFRGVVKKQNAALSLGAALACVLRYACHVISGATVWAGLSIPTTAALAYSFVYNATYMIPETIVTVLAAYYIASLLDLTRDIPVRLKHEKSASGAPMWLGIGAVSLILAALIYDVVAVFSHMQNPDSGEFDIQAFAASHIWVPVLIVTAAVALVATALLFVRRNMISRAQPAPADGDSEQPRA